MSGWASLPFVELDGRHLTIAAAALLFGLPEEDLRVLVKVAGIAPSGVLRTSPYARQGRQPQAYPKDKLIAVNEALIALREAVAGP